MDADRLTSQSAVPLVPVTVPAAARDAAARLHGALQRAGFDVERDFEHCRADVTISGMGNITLGRLPVTTALRLAEALEGLPSGGDVHDGGEIHHVPGETQRAEKAPKPDRGAHEC